MNKTQWFKAAHGKKVRKTVSGVPTKEDIPAIVANMKEQLLAQGAKLEDIKITDKDVSIGGQFWLLPAFEKEVIAIFTTRSKDYIHNNTYGNKTDATIDQNGNMVKRIPHTQDGLITFEILED